MLIHEGHRVVAMTRTSGGAATIEATGATPVIGDVFDEVRLPQLAKASQPEIVIHQLTAFGATDADPLTATIRVRTEGTRNLVAAAKSAGARRFLTQSISFICQPIAGLTDEDTPLYLDAPEPIQPLARSVAELERRTLAENDMEGVVLRYGWFYGLGTNYDPAGPIPRAIKSGRMPIVGTGNGTYSFIHVRDAAAATMKALTHARPGIYNIVDDSPARLSEWLPVAAELLGAPPPLTMDEALARKKLGDMLVYIFNEQCGASNEKAKAALAWQPSFSSWKAGFRSLFATTT
jgi:nucleoside-diphosphate-sugar epimerase